MKNNDLFIVSGATIKELAYAYDVGDHARFFAALDKCRKRSIPEHMDHVCQIEIEPNSLKVNMIRIAPIRDEQYQDGYDDGWAGNPAEPNADDSYMKGYQRARSDREEFGGDEIQVPEDAK